MKKMHFQPTGMNRDVSQHLYSPQNAYEIRNMRIMATDDQTTLALVNERGTSEMTCTSEDSENTNELDSVSAFDSNATIIGSARYEDYIVYFATTTTDEADDPRSFFAGEDIVDYIYRAHIVSDTEYELALLYKGDMNFSALHPIQSVIRVDTVSQVLVYWTDSVNEVSRLNIFSTTTATTTNANEICLLPKIPIVEGTVTKAYGSGNFPAGVIQYFATCFNKGGAESNIIWRSPIHYLTNDCWGSEAGTPVSCYFTIKISQTASDTGIQLGSFDYVRLYSVIRTTKDGDGIAALIGTYGIKTDTTDDVTTYSVIITDTNDSTTAVDASLLYNYKYPTIAKTIQAKQDRLFFGGVKTMTNSVAEKITVTESSDTITLSDSDGSSSGTVSISFGVGDAYSPDEGQLNDGADVVTTFRNREYYYFGIIAYNSYGVPSDVIPLSYTQVSGASGKKITPIITLDSKAVDILSSYGMIKVEPVIVQGLTATRTIETQGWTNHTVFNLNDRAKNGGIMPSWFLRPYTKKMLWDQGGQFMTDTCRKDILQDSKDSAEVPFGNRHITYQHHGVYQPSEIPTYKKWYKRVYAGSDDSDERAKIYTMYEVYAVKGEAIVSDDEASESDYTMTGVVSAGHFQSISYPYSRNCEVQSTIRIPTCVYCSGSIRDAWNKQDYLTSDEIAYVAMSGHRNAQYCKG